MTIPKSLMTAILFFSLCGPALPSALVQLENDHTFSVKTRTLSGSYMVPADADSAPSYSVYEKEDTPALLTGTMAKFDSKTGYYLETIAVTAANGFEVGKSYNICIEATVAAVTDFTMRSFEVESSVATLALIKAKTDAIGSLTLTITSPISTTGDVTLIQGDDYTEPTHSLNWTDSSGAWPTLTSASISMVIFRGTTLVLTKAGSVIIGVGDTKQIRVELTAAETTLFAAQEHRYIIKATLASTQVRTLVRGKLTVTYP